MSTIEETVMAAVESRSQKIVQTLCDLVRYPSIVKADPRDGGVLKGEGGGRSIMLTGHIDVVPSGAPEHWVSDPFTPVVAEGFVRGRGTVDMKGGVACMLMAVETLKEIGVELGGDVVFTSVVDEEIGGMGSLAMVDRGYRADAGIMTEPTALLPCAMASCGDASSSTASAVMRS
jgi:acetylornithine deacetylase/succinyl-diaminopimelate desuccinylase-like protein